VRRSRSAPPSASNYPTEPDIESRRVLVTNDDGVFAPGLAVLAAAVRELGHEVVVVAPDREMSGSSSSMGPMAYADHISYERVELPELPDVEAFAVDGPPAMCVIAASLGGFGSPPDLVASGVNPGVNCGRATLHSGTIGAALTAAKWGCSGLAVSIGLAERIHWKTAAAYAQAALGALADTPAGTTVNLNVPNLPIGDVKGIRYAELAPFNAVRTIITGRAAGRLYVGRQPTEYVAPEGTDTALVEQGFATITFLAPVTSANPPYADLPDPGFEP
jgi:5'-nucleotidase